MFSSTAPTAVTTPQKSTPATPPVTESPGTWRHPRLPEIIRRQDATNFTEKNVKRIAINVFILLTCMLLHSVLSQYLPPRKWWGYTTWVYARYTYWTVLAIPIFNIGTNLLPLIRKKDDFSDIPLTPGQRRLLGLPPTNVPPTPGSVYSTPPRYARTPSISGSAGSKRSFSGSPRSTASNDGSPTRGSGNLGGLGSPSSPLLHKAMNGARRSSFGSLGSPNLLGTSVGSSLGASFGASTGSFFGGVPDTPSPIPPAGKRSTIGLNSKWLYERGRDRRSSGSAWLHT
ncbi:NPCC-domain-containing protein [Hypoxylon sp. NC0597]|nr:NPCC-domain-containing protein [Hypoxylon sp. NC0597]